ACGEHAPGLDQLLWPGETPWEGPLDQMATPVAGGWAIAGNDRETSAMVRSPPRIAAAIAFGRPAVRLAKRM
ncbi:hypothetical protein MRX96_050086, partial [Rhipicephalus microplus]